MNWSLRPEMEPSLPDCPAPPFWSDPCCIVVLCDREVLIN